MDKFEYVNEVAEKINLEFINRIKNLTKKDKYISLLLGIDNEPFFLRGLDKNTAPTIVNTITYAGNIIFCNSIKDGLKIDSYIAKNTKKEVSEVITEDGFIKPDASLPESAITNRLRRILTDTKYGDKEFSNSKKYAIYSREINGLKCHFVDIKLNKKIYKKLKSNRYIINMFCSKVYMNNSIGIGNIVHCKKIFDISCIILDYKG